MLKNVLKMLYLLAHFLTIFPEGGLGKEIKLVATLYTPGFFVLLICWIKKNQGQMHFALFGEQK